MSASERARKAAYDRRTQRANARLRWAARRLELRSFALTPEHFDLAGGCRAAIATGVPLGLAVSTGTLGLAWAVFAAFWTCLCDTPGPDRLRRRLLAIFVVFGTAIALAGASIAAWLPGAALVIGPALVFTTLLGAGRIAHGGSLGTLLAVVAVVAVGFPHPLAGAALQALSFLGGAAWAYLLINLVWRTDAAQPLFRARDAVGFRLLDMSDSLVALGRAPQGSAFRHDHAEHRRTVRLAIERLRGLLDRYTDMLAAAAPFLRAADLLTIASCAA